MVTKKFILALSLTFLTGALTTLVFFQSQGSKSTDFVSIRNMLREPNSNDAFNDIELSEFENFYRDWHLVTARYRIDRNQQRVTFANDIAWKTLLEGSNVFPEGSMFAKVGFEVGEDPRFPSSKVPGSQLRVLLMKRDFSKYKETDGWGYALLNRFGTRLTSGEVKVEVEKYRSIQQIEKACHACHQLVPDRDFVFSRPMFDAVLDYKQVDLRLPTLLSKFRTPTSEDQVHIDSVLAHISADSQEFKNVQYHEMLLFEGSLPELRAPLTNLSNEKRLAFLIFDRTSKFFAFSIPLPPTQECQRLERYVTGCLNPTIPERNRVEVSKDLTLCNGMTL